MHHSADTRQGRLAVSWNQAVSCEEFSTATSHPLPPSNGFLFILWLTEHLAFKRQHRIATQHGADVRISAGIKSLVDCHGLGLGQKPHKLSRISMVNGALINTTDTHTVRNGRLLQQSSTGGRRRGKKEHRNTTLQNGS